jgi:hypothetical protein
MNYSTNESTKILSDYTQKIERALREKIENQINGKWNTTNGEYEIIKIEHFSLHTINIEDEKFHLLFSPTGCEISGNISIRALAYPPGSDRNGYTSHYFEINFNPTNIKFNFENEIFIIENNIDISYISVNRNHFF